MIWLCILCDKESMCPSTLLFLPLYYFLIVDGTQHFATPINFWVSFGYSVLISPLGTDIFLDLELHENEVHLNRY